VVGDCERILLYCFVLAVSVTMASSKLPEERNTEDAEEVEEQEPCIETSREPICRQTSVGERAMQRWRQLRRLLVMKFQ